MEGGGFVDRCLQLLLILWQLIFYVPGVEYIATYLKTAYQDDPFRIFLEGVLILFTIKYLKRKRRDKQVIKLTQTEIDELIEEWTPLPLAPKELPSLAKYNVDSINSITSKVELLVSTADSSKLALNLVSFNPLGILNMTELLELSASAIRKYGVGTCGPPGFYGTLDIHLELESTIAAFIGTESAILYSQNFSAMSSVIPAFAKRGDVIVCDDGVNFAIQKGVQISRSDIFYFLHNDMNNLESVLMEIDKIYKGKPLTRRFIVTEGLFAKYGDVCPLPKIVELKKKFKYRLILDESLSIGSIGERGAGLTDYFQNKIEVEDIDMIIGSIGHAFGATGGFCAGSRYITEHQRLGGQAYCFSASLPAPLTTFALNAIRCMPGTKMDSSQPSTLPEKLLPCRKKIEASLKNLPLYINKVYDVLKSTLPASFLIRNLGYPSCLLLIQMSSEEINSERNFVYEAKILQEVVNLAIKKDIYITRSKVIDSQELQSLPPSIKICISGAFSDEQIDELIGSLSGVFIEIDKAKLLASRSSRGTDYDGERIVSGSEIASK